MCGVFPIMALFEEKIHFISVTRHSTCANMAPPSIAELFLNTVLCTSAWILSCNVIEEYPGEEAMFCEIEEPLMRMDELLCRNKRPLELLCWMKTDFSIMM